MGSAERTVSVAERNYLYTVTIAGSASLSGAVDLGPFTLCGLLLASTWDTNVISFAASTTLGGTYVPILSASGAEVATGSIAASKWIALDPADFAGIRFLKIRSGTSSAAVNQGDDTIVTLVVRTV